ncbi:MAG: GNAT family N-acetyltransferase [Chlamydiia bacterium]|nr:GNAT family N-acetyltransferase [Chlamydiia bacterium]
MIGIERIQPRDPLTVQGIVSPINRELLWTEYDDPICDKVVSGIYTLWLARYDEEVVGYAALHRDGRETHLFEGRKNGKVKPYLSFLAVKARFRGKGVGLKLLHEAIQAGGGKVYLHCPPHSRQHFFYRHLREKGYAYKEQLPSSQECVLIKLKLQQGDD